MDMNTTMRIVRLGLALAVSASVVVTAMPAGAQERTERKTILQLLFGTPKRKEIIREPEARKPRTVTVNARRKSRPPSSPNRRRW
jgi:hypothetical protein